MMAGVLEQKECGSPPVDSDKIIHCFGQITVLRSVPLALAQSY